MDSNPQFKFSYEQRELTFAFVLCFMILQHEKHKEFYPKNVWAVAKSFLNNVQRFFQ